MTGVSRHALGFFLPLTVLAACSLSSPNTVTYTGYYLTCCMKADIDHVWQPDTTVELHWIVGSAPRTTVNPTHKAVASAVLMGPYADVATLKQAKGAKWAVQGSVVTMDDRTRPSVAPVSIFALPADLPPGYYNLNIKWDLGDGGSAGGGSIVRVGPQP